MKERPILFNGDMVRAILEGRKTQTRRVMKVQPPGENYKLWKLSDTTSSKDRKHIGKNHWCRMDKGNLTFSDKGDKYFTCPYGKIGDQLWVRETWQLCENELLVKNEPSKTWEPNPELSVVYRATSPKINPDHPEWGYSRWKSSIHMPRYASRIQLEITDIRVERVQDICDAEAQTEGVDLDPEKLDKDIPYFKTSFINLWNTINKKRGYSWKSNPWVWVIEFKRKEG